jgi:hypothetical protein
MRDRQARAELQDAYWYFDAAANRGDGEVFGKSYVRSLDPSMLSIHGTVHAYKTPMEIAYGQGLSHLKRAGVTMRRGWGHASTANAKAMRRALREQAELFGWSVRNDCKIDETNK